MQKKILALILLFALLPVSTMALSPEIHYIGVYEGTPNRKFKKEYEKISSRYIQMVDKPQAWLWYNEQLDELSEEHPPAVRVRVTKKDVPLILVLSSYDPAIWSIEAEEGVNIQKIYLAGYHTQLLKEKDKYTIESCTYESNCPDWFTFDSNDSESRYRYDFDTRECVEEKDEYQEYYYSEGREKLKKLVGSDPFSLQGAYTGNIFDITGDTRGDMMKEYRESGYCYRDEDGVLRGKDVGFPEQQ